MVHVPFGTELVMDRHAPDHEEARMDWETTVEIDAPADRVWRALSEAEKWPQWTKSMREVTWLNGGTLKVGSRARVKQPASVPLVWEVSEVDPGNSFSWRTSSFGVAAVGAHVIRTIGTDKVALTLSIHQSGSLSPIVSLLMARRTRRFVQMEAEGLKRCAESTPVSD